MWPFKKKQKIPVTFQGFRVLFPVCNEEYQKEVLEILHKQPRPSTLCGQAVPETLNGISYGTLDDLHGVDDEDKAPYAIAKILLGVTKEQVDQEDVNRVFGFLNFVQKEVERINKLFQSIKTRHSPEELQAGVESLDFGSFGVLDWYAKRQGISNQNEVRSVAWIRIFQCMKMDNEKAEYERRLHEVYNRKAHRK